MKNILSALTPRALIINAVTSQLEKNNVDKVILSFNVMDDKYSVLMSAHPEGKEERTSLELGQDEINTIKKVFINKIGKAYHVESDNEIKNIIIEIDVLKKDFNVFIETPFGKVEQFNYLKR